MTLAVGKQGIPPQLPARCSQENDFRRPKAFSYNVFRQQSTIKAEQSILEATSALKVGCVFAVSQRLAIDCGFRRGNVACGYRRFTLSAIWVQKAPEVGGYLSRSATFDQGRIMTFSDGMTFDQPGNKSSSQGHGSASSLLGRVFATAGDFQFQKQEVENAFVHVLINNEARAELFLNAFEERRTRPWLPEGAEEATSALAGAIRTAITVCGLELPEELSNWDHSRGDTNGTSSGYKISERDIRAALNLALTETALREFEQAAELTTLLLSARNSPQLLEKHVEQALLAYVKNSDAGSSPDPW